MKVVYIAHPIGGDVARNIRRVELILEYYLKLRGNVFPIAPYLHACRYLEDQRPDDRARAFVVNGRYFAGGVVDELWVCGEKSEGVREEMEMAMYANIPVVFVTLPDGLKEALANV